VFVRVVIALIDTIMHFPLTRRSFLFMLQGVDCDLPDRLPIPESHGYRQGQNQPFIFYRDVSSGGNTITIEVDLLAGEYKGTGSRHRTQRIQDANARKSRGC